MSYKYIVLVGRRGPPIEEELQSAQKALEPLGVELRTTFGSIALFASPGTPILRLANDGIVIGHLFCREGEPVTTPYVAAEHADANHTQQHVLNNYWGEYVLLHSGSANAAGTVLLRDPSGGVACFYSLDGGKGFVTSHTHLAETLGIYQRSVDWNYVAHCLRHPSLKSRHTGLAGLQELHPGFSLSVRGPDLKIRECWSPWSFVEANRRYGSFHDAAAGVRSAVTRSVKAWAEADRSVLLELSGGLDSSIVAASLKGVDSRVSCCTVTTPVRGTGEQRYASQMADYLGGELKVLHLAFDAARFDFAPPVDAVVPGTGPLQYAVNSAMEATALSVGATSFFSGAGGDTVFSYLGNAAPAADAFLEGGTALGLKAVRDLSDLHHCTLWKAARLTFRKLVRKAKVPTEADQSFLKADSNPGYAETHPWFTSPPGTFPGDQERIVDLAGTQMFRSDAPRATSHWLRMPLLSQPVVEECLRAPTWMAIHGGRNRAVARAAFSDPLPHEIVHRGSKSSFVNFLGAYFQRNRRQVREFLLTGNLHARGYLDADSISRFVQSTSPLRDHSFVRLLELCMIENWIRHQR